LKFFSLLTLILIWNLAFSQENLYLTGYIRSYDKSTSLVNIHVTTPGCEGLRQFYYPKEALDDLEPSVLGKKVDFFINAPSCERGRIYQMYFK
jgi:hypothetical protein